MERKYSKDQIKKKVLKVFVFSKWIPWLPLHVHIKKKFIQHMTHHILIASKMLIHFI